MKKQSSPSKRPSRRIVLLICLTILGSMVFGSGLNLVLIDQGVRKDPAIHVQAIVEECHSKGSCTVTYWRHDKNVEATFFLQGRSVPTKGEVVDVVTYARHPERVYVKTSVNSAVGAIAMAFGVVFLVIGCAKLFRHWRQEALGEKSSDAVLDE